MVLVTVPVAVSILDTEPDPLLVTYAVLPFGVIATPNGSESTVMVLVTVPVAVSILDTEPDPLLVTYAVRPSGVTATPIRCNRHPGRLQADGNGFGDCSGGRVDPRHRIRLGVGDVCGAPIRCN